MSARYQTWEEARVAAQATADRLEMDVAIRTTVEFGRRGFSVTLADRNGSDYARAEIVTPRGEGRG